MGLYGGKWPSENSRMIFTKFIKIYWILQTDRLSIKKSSFFTGRLKFKATSK